MTLCAAIPGTAGQYAADTDGNVYSLRRGGPVLMNPYRCNDGYLRVSIYMWHGRKRSMAVHRLIAYTFLQSDDSSPYVNHKNGDKTDNRLENLEWVTPGENVRHAVRSGLHRMDKKCSAELIERAKTLRSQGVKYQAIADAISKSISTAYHYVNKNSGGR